MSDSAVQSQSAAAVWRAPLPHEWDTSDRVPEMAPAEITFGELLSALNPLQHIPIVGSIYREITGETLHPAARVLGGALIGGPMGLVASAFNAIIEQATGRDLAAHAIALVMPDETAPATTVASTDSAPADAPVPTPAVAVATTAPVAPEVAPDLATIAPAAGLPIPSLRKDAAKPAETQGRDLAYYQTHAGQRLANAGGTTPNRQITATAAAAAPAALRQPGSAPVPAMTPTRGAEMANEVTPGNEPADVWFAKAMMQGLDRYRESKRLESTTPHVDVAH